MLYPHCELALKKRNIWDVDLMSTFTDIALFYSIRSEHAGKTITF